MTASWHDLVAAAPELAEGVRTRLAAGRYALLATTRSDGFPRISGVVPGFTDEGLVLTVRQGSAIAADLHRDARCALHSGPRDGGGPSGDAKLTATAVPAAGEAGAARFALALVDATVVRLTAERDAHLVESWRAGERGSRVERR